MGCGVGAQTLILLRRNPGIHLTAIDMSAESVQKAREMVEHMMKLLRVGGTITLIEGDHSSGKWTPETEASRAAWNGLVISQQMLWHDPDIGKRLHEIMPDAGINQPQVESRALNPDQSDPILLDDVVNQIITPMVYSAEKHVLANKLLDPQIWSDGLMDLSQVVASAEGTFFYSWFKGVGLRTY